MLTDKEQEEIRRKLLGLEEEPPANGWNKIAADIQPPRNPNRLWWLLAALLLLVGSVGVLYFVKQPREAELTTKANNTELKPENTEVETIAKQHTDQAITQLHKPSIAPGEITGNTSEVNTNKTQEGQPQRPEKQPVAGNKSAVNTPQPKQPVKLPLPLAVEGKQPRDKYKTEPSAITEERKIASKITLTEKSATTETSIENQEGEAEQTITANPKSSSNTTSPDLLQGLITQLPGRSGLQVPDSVSIALAPDSVVKVVRTPAVDSIAKSSEWYVGVTFAPRYTFRSFTPAASDDIYITNLNNYEKLDPKRMGYEFGLNVGKQLSPQLYLESSLNVMQLQEKVAYAYTTGKVDTLLKTRGDDGSIRVVPVYVKGERQLESTFTYGGLRVGVNYYFLQTTRSRLNVTLAGGANLLLKGRTKEYINGQPTETIVFPSEKDLFEQTNYNLLLGAGYNTSLGGNYELMLMPSLNYFLGSTFSKREPFGLKPYTLGLSIQLKRRFIR